MTVAGLTRRRRTGTFARMEQPAEPVQLGVKVGVLGQVQRRPLDDVLVVVHAPRAPALSVAAVLVVVLGVVARADLPRHGVQLQLAAPRQLGALGRWGGLVGVLAGAQRATTS